MKKRYLIPLTLFFFGWLSISVAQQYAQPDTLTANKLAAWEHMAMYEGCMNGDVSSTGKYPNQQAEDMSFGSLHLMAFKAQSVSSDTSQPKSSAISI